MACIILRCAYFQGSFLTDTSTRRRKKEHTHTLYSSFAHTHTRSNTENAEKRMRFLINGLSEGRRAERRSIVDSE